MDWANLISGLSALAAALTFIFGVRVYANEQFKNRVAAIRSTIEDLRQSLDRINDFIGERSANQFSIAFSRHLREVFSEQMSPADFAAAIRSEKYDNLLIQCMYEAYENTDVGKALTSIRDKSAQASGLLRVFSPVGALFIEKITDSICKIVSSLYSVSSLKMALLESAANREEIAKMVEAEPQVNTAYFLLGEEAANIASQSSLGYGIKILTPLLRMGNTFIDRLLLLSDTELRKAKNVEDPSQSFAMDKLSNLESRQDTLTLLFNHSKGILSIEDREIIQHALGAHGAAIDTKVLGSRN